MPGLTSSRAGLGQGGRRRLLQARRPSEMTSALLPWSFPKHCRGGGRRREKGEEEEEEEEQEEKEAAEEEEQGEYMNAKCP